jgi:hypothetical protein
MTAGALHLIRNRPPGTSAQERLDSEKLKGIATEKLATNELGFRITGQV